MRMSRSLRAKLFFGVVQGLGAALIWSSGMGDRRAGAEWGDRRPIAMLHLASTGHRSPSNPRGWLNDTTMMVHDPTGVKNFHSRMLAYANQSVKVIKKVGGQGMIVWDLEGEEFDHKITYIGDPRLAEALAPEWHGIIDAFFQTFRSAGLKVGVTVRPQQFTAPGKQLNLWNPGVLLIEKIRYAKERWGISYAEIDTNRWGYYILPAPILRRVQAAHPDVLLIPDHAWPGYYAFSAPIRELREESPRPPWLSALYPKGFSIISIADATPEQLTTELRQAVRQGDILMFRGWFEDQSGRAAREITQEVSSLQP